MTRINRLLIALMLTLILGASTPQAKAQAPRGDESPQEFERSAYRIRFLLTFNRHPYFTETRREKVRRLMAAHVRRVVGSAWDLTLEEAPDLLRECTVEEIRQLEDTKIRDRASGYDKLFVVGVNLVQSSLVLCGREHDTATRHTGPVFSARTAAQSAWHHTLLKLCLRMFSPLARVSRAESRSVHLVVKGGQLRACDPDLAWTPPGRAFSAFRRFFRRDREPPEITQVPWTFVEVDQVRGASVTAAIRSRLRRPFTRRTDRRNDILALGLSPTGQPTRVRFLDEATNTPLIGYTAVYKSTQGATKAVSTNTDRSGSVVVPPQTAGLTRLLLRQGQRSVALLYLVSGQESEITVPLNAAESLLALSSELKALEAEFVDLVARRVILVQSIERHLAKAEVDEAQALFERLDALPTKFEFQGTRIDTFIATAQSQSGGKLADKLAIPLAELQSQVDKYLDEDRIGRVRRKIRRIRQESAKSQAAPRVGGSDGSDS